MIFPVPRSYEFLDEQVSPNIMGFYLPLVVIAVLASLIAAGMLVADTVLGPRYRDDQKESPYECGIKRQHRENTRTNVRAPFFPIALLFLVFGVEVAFLFVWGIEIRSLGWNGFIAMTFWLGVLLLGLAYAWRKGALRFE